MKKLLSIVCIASLSLSMAACATNKPEEKETIAPPSAQEDKVEEVPLTGEITGEITVSSYETALYKDFLETAAAAFEERYPGTKINVSTFSVMPEVKTMEKDGMKLAVMTKGDDTQSKTDYISAINTELMSGQGADVLSMDVIPYYKYADNGQLEDLQKYMDSDPNFNKKNYKENILNAMKYKNGLYAFPLDYSFNFFGYDSSFFSEEEQKPLQEAETLTYEQFIDLGQKSFETVNSNSPTPIKMFGLDDIMMYNQLLHENYNNFINVETKTVNLADGSFSKLLDTVKEYSEKGYLNLNNMKPDLDKDISIDSIRSNRDEKFLYKLMNSSALMQHFNKDAKMLRVTMSVGMAGGNSENDELSGMLANIDGNISFDNSQSYGINSNSKNKELAWEFIKFLTTAEMQNSFYLMGLPINNNARLEKAEMEITGELYNPERNAEVTELTEEQKAILEDYITLIEKSSDKLNYYIVEDDTINSFMNTEVAYFFDGTKSADEVAETLQNKISLYLNE